MPFFVTAVSAVEVPRDPGQTRLCLMCALSAASTKEGKNLIVALFGLCSASLLSQLREAGVIAMDEDEFSVQPTPHGVLFSRFMVRFDSMKALMSVSENHGIRSERVGTGIS